MVIFQNSITLWLLGRFVKFWMFWAALIVYFLILILLCDNGRLFCDNARRLGITPNDPELAKIIVRMIIRILCKRIDSQVDITLRLLDCSLVNWRVWAVTSNHYKFLSGVLCNFALRDNRLEYWDNVWQPMGLVGWAIELHPDRAATALISRQQSAVIAKQSAHKKSHK